MNLIPDKPGDTPNYWCTWNAQHPMWYIQTDEELARFDVYAATEGGNAARSRMNQHALFEDPGWATNFWPSIRSDLYLCLDDGWDVPPVIDLETERWRFGSLVLNRERFPAFDGSPAESLRRINERVKSLGWRGVALWVAAQCEGDGGDERYADEASTAAYWRERARWSAAAGIEYWKVDWGRRANSPSFRRLLTDIARQEAPGLLVEHARSMAPINYFAGSGRFEDWPGVFEQSLEILSASDVFRSYDEFEPLRLPIALDRIAALARRVSMQAPAQGLINCEDNVYLGAALGCAFGIMRIPVKNPWTRWQWPNIDEAVRAVRWQRIAPAFGLPQAELHAAPVVLSDNARMPQDHWFTAAAGQDVQQHAPAILSRGLPLPQVSGPGAVPFVVAAQNPAGALAVATLPRCRDGKLEIPLADVAVSDVDARFPIGIFGRYRSLTLRLKGLPRSVRVWGQDLLADTAQDLTTQVTLAGNALVLDGALIERIGLAARSADDPSDPGLVLKLECEILI